MRGPYHSKLGGDGRVDGIGGRVVVFCVPRGIQAVGKIVGKSGWWVFSRDACVKRETYFALVVFRGNRKNDRSFHFRDIVFFDMLDQWALFVWIAIDDSCCILEGHPAEVDCFTYSYTISVAQ